MTKEKPEGKAIKIHTTVRINAYEHALADKIAKKLNIKRSDYLNMLIHEGNLRYRNKKTC